MVAEAVSVGRTTEAAATLVAVEVSLHCVRFKVTVPADETVVGAPPACAAIGAKSALRRTKIANLIFVG
jgi:hypothetical protein